jgi:hypothetical protein
VKRASGLLMLMLIGFAPVGVSAQTTTSDADRSRGWIAIGGALTTLHGDCQDCEPDSGYLHTGTLFVNVGRSVNSRMNIGTEVFWVPATSAAGDHMKATFVMAAAQFTPWESYGFFLKTGMGMAFVRNWVYDASGENPPFTAKALGLTYGAGWAFRRSQRLGLEISGTQHVAALGDFQTSAALVENVVSNFWSLGVAIVIR